YVEVLCYPFVSASTMDALGVPADDPRRQAVRLRNPLSEEEPLMRTTLLPPLLATLRRNLGRGLRDLALYEIGLVFHPSQAPAVCAALELPRRTCAMELTLDKLPLPPVARAPEISAFPPALIDVALVVNAGTPAAEVQLALEAGAGDLLESIRLFDVYAGEQL